MNTQTSHTIKHRKTANDVFYTPVSVVKNHLKCIKSYESDVWYDPFAGKQVYFDNFPTSYKVYTEISQGSNFFDFNGKADIICSNPPYSIIDDVLEKSVQIKPRIISYLLFEGKMTPKRIEYLNKKGYSMTHMYMCKVFSWYGMAVAYTFEYTGDVVDNTVEFTYDRIVHRNVTTE